MAEKHGESPKNQKVSAEQICDLIGDTIARCGDNVGIEALSRVTGITDWKYLKKKIKADPSASFIYALVGSCGPEYDFLVSVNSVPSGCEFVPWTFTSSAENWQKMNNAKKDTSGLIRWTVVDG